jgi:hypothetical protein
MRRVFVLSALSILALLFPYQTDAAYRHMSRLEVIARAEVIVMGTVTQVDESTIDLKIDRQIVGSVATGQTIVVGKFHDWACAWRWGRYYVGEQLLMFLNPRDDGSGKYYILGAGDEGESPIHGDRADAYEHVLEKVAWDDRDNGPFSRGTLAQVRAAIRDVRFAYVFTLAARPRHVPGDWRELVFDHIGRVTNRPAPGEFKKRYPPGMEVPYRQFEHRSPIHSYLYDEIRAEQRRIQAAPPPPPPLRSHFASI